MTVELLNPEEVKSLFVNWSQTSSVCYDSMINPEKPEAIGKHCMASGHFSGSRGDYFKFLITDVPRFTFDQLFRTSVGFFGNMASFRYIDKDGFFYEIPAEITDSRELLTAYDLHMMATLEMYEKIQTYVFNKTGKKERANEQARYVLPMATHTSAVVGYTIEALIHMMNQRLCVRTEDVYRHLAQEMRRAVLEVLPNLESKLVPNCQALLWCPEGRQSCGAYPTKKELEAKLKGLKG